MITILYVYGMNSHPNNGGITKLRSCLPSNEFRFINRYYPQEDAEKSVSFLEEIVRNEKVDIVFGESLGAFIVMCMNVNVPKVIFNPCAVPSMFFSALRFLAKHPFLEAKVSNWLGKKIVAPSEEMCKSYKSLEPNRFAHVSPGSFCFLGTHDELLRNFFHCSLKKHYKLGIVESGHRMSYDAAKAIAAYIKTLNFT